MQNLVLLVVVVSLNADVSIQKEGLAKLGCVYGAMTIASRAMRVYSP